ncbi:flagellar motor protein MotD [Chitinilyticum piscinae]|uniref:Flagellar motor protein MotD n=1 Tax=Chitinilyticum piscinae TaxID=2866724 RepID=A0A8J7KD94_9NEIS|nr:flagellar motor protein MotD [Chitinilyticum piscinae]MBE9608559.1 flagellar motor protein MotD [Chitinilyticum piscinae]
MSRRKHLRHDDHDNHERWLVSYADFITLLFAFFVVMYAISSVNEGKYRVLSDSLVTAFKQPPTSTKVIQLGNQTVMGAPPKAVALPAPPVPNQATAEQARKMQEMASKVKSSLDTLIDQGKVKVTQSKRGIAVEISDSILFDTGRAELQAPSIDALTKLALLVKDTDNLIQIEGHTDNAPINSPQFPSNWELSGARAASVVRVFAAAGVAPQRMVAIGYGEYRPMDSNDSPESRARNRRVTLNILADNKDEVAVLPVDDSAKPAGQ